MEAASACITSHGELFTGAETYVKGKGKGKCIYIALIFVVHARRSGIDHSFTCNYTNACIYLVSVHQMAPAQTEVVDIYNCSLLLIYLPRKDERPSRPGWLTYSGRFTHITHKWSCTRQLQVASAGQGKFAGQLTLVGGRGDRCAAEATESRVVYYNYTCIQRPRMR